jgi:glycosyltransferase involved in cell wall biosynthesis
MFGLPQEQIIVFPPKKKEIEYDNLNDNEDDNEDDNDNDNEDEDEDENEDENENEREKVKVNVNVKINPFRFIYPAYPDVHKNFECLCEAARLLEQEVGPGHFEVLLTTVATFNRYSKWLHRRWGDVTSLQFCGFLSQEQLYACYSQSDCLVFPSYVETWGLPISEFAATGRPMLLADLPYAHESAAGCSQVAFFNPNRPEQLKQLMYQLLHGDHGSMHDIEKISPQPPMVNNWGEFINKICNTI